MLMDEKFIDMDLKEEFDRGIINIGNSARIGRVISKANSGEAIKVGFIGGSITAGAAASNSDSCYAHLVYEWWKNRFPMSKVEYINAGIGATTSEFGAARVEDDLLKAAPDIVFVEFSVNDEDNNKFMETFEGLVRKILLYPSEPALFMFNNAFYDDGRSAQRVHNIIGKYYDLPIVSIRESIFYEITKGKIKNTDISSDNLHPNDLGHRLVAGVITNLLEQIAVAAEQDKQIMIYTVPKQPYTSNRFFTSKRRNNRNCYPKLYGFEADEKEKLSVWDNFRYGWFAQKTGSRIHFEVEASFISVQYRKYTNHPAPIAKLFIDGDEKNAVTLDANFNETWGDCLYLQNIFADDNRKRHTVEIIVTEEVLEKSFYLASLITA
jgi:lysophospholipase L1-like esterase